MNIMNTLLGYAAMMGGDTKPVVPQKTCVIYTDGLLDDLCAIEYLSRFYTKAVVLLTNGNDLPTSDYAPDNYNTEEFGKDVRGWFREVVLTEESGISGLGLTFEEKPDAFLFCNATAICNDDLSRFAKLTVMGSYDGIVNRLNDEWNSSQDMEAFKKILAQNVIPMVVMSKQDCEAYPNVELFKYLDLKYYNEYYIKMTALNDSTCCYDLVAAITSRIPKETKYINDIQGLVTSIDAKTPEQVIMMCNFADFIYRRFKTSTCAWIFHGKGVSESQLTPIDIHNEPSGSYVVSKCTGETVNSCSVFMLYNVTESSITGKKQWGRQTSQGFEPYYYGDITKYYRIGMSATTQMAHYKLFVNKYLEGSLVDYFNEVYTKREIIVHDEDLVDGLINKYEG